MALFLTNDAEHARARELFAMADSSSWRLLTTNAVVFETYAVLLRRSREARRTAIAFLEVAERRVFEIERILPEDEARAVSILR
ncbi:hypothetical protein K8I61_19730 [bacterium]|nr:hypothetical protein [bacterium]